MSCYGANRRAGYVCPAFVTRIWRNSDSLFTINVLRRFGWALIKRGVFRVRFADYGKRVVFAAFDGGEITSDAGGLCQVNWIHSESR